MLQSLTNPDIWIALFKIAAINVLLSGDNAIVIALACRSLPLKQQKRAFAIGAAGIVVLMTALTAFAAYLLTLPYLEIIGSVLLLWIAVKLLEPADEGGDEESEIEQSAHFWGAVKTIVVADIVMSFDNVLGMAGAARGHLGMLFVGMVITIPLVLFGSAMIMKLMQRIPIFITLGAGLLGWVAGEMAVADPAIGHSIEANGAHLGYIVPMLGAASVLIAGRLRARKQAVEKPDAQAEPSSPPARDLAS